MTPAQKTSELLAIALDQPEPHLASALSPRSIEFRLRSPHVQNDPAPGWLFAGEGCRPLAASSSRWNCRIMPSRSLASEARFFSASTASSAPCEFSMDKLRDLAGGLGDFSRGGGLLGGRRGDQLNLVLHLL